MTHNAYRYYIVNTDATTLSELAALNINVNNYSTDGTIAIVDNNDNILPALTTYGALPSYVAETMDAKDLSNEEALIIQSYIASSNGASDGYTFNNKGV